MKHQSAQRWSIALAFLHAVVFAAFLAYYLDVNQRDGQAMLLWTYWLIIDFPVSLLVPLGWSFISPESDLSRYWLYFVHGVAGTLWWYLIPFAVGAIYRRLVRQRPEGIV